MLSSGGNGRNCRRISRQNEMPHTREKPSRKEESPPAIAAGFGLCYVFRARGARRKLPLQIALFAACANGADLLLGGTAIEGLDAGGLLAGAATLVLGELLAQ